jgi:hypothetical protein
MAILHLSIRSIRTSEPCIFAIFEHIIFKFWILIEGYIKINDTFGFFDSLCLKALRLSLD